MPLKWIKISKSVIYSLCVASILSACAMTNKKEEESASIHLQLGVRYMDMNQLEIAKENLLIALDKAPNNPQVYNALAFLYEKLDDTTQARHFYEKALDARPDDWSIQNNLGRFHCEHGELEQGMTLLTKAISTRLNDKPWLALTNAGRCQISIKQQQSAKSYFKQALLFNAEYTPALLEMQKISYQNGEYWLAKAYLQRYLSSADHTASSLWFAIKTEYALGNRELAKEYQKLLLDRFPLSDEAKHLPPDLQ